MNLTKGGNALLEETAESLESIVLGVTWDSGSLDCDLVAIVCDAEKQALSNDHFIFWNQTATPDRSVVLRSVSDPVRESPDRAQLLVALSSMPRGADLIVLAVATVVEGATLGSLRSLRFRAMHPSTGSQIASYSMGQEIERESCLVVAEVYKHQNRWKVRAVGQGYQAGLAGLGRDYGVDIA